MYTADREDVDPGTSTVHAIAVLPPVVYVTPGDEFTVQARLYDGENGALPAPAGLLAWDRGIGLTERAQGGDSIVLKAAATSGSNVRTTVTAKVGEHRGIAVIVILDPNAAGTRDSVWTDYTSGGSPDVVLIDDTLASAAVDDSVVSFSQVGPLGDLHGGPGEIARLSSNQAFRILGVTWASGQNVVNFRTSGTGGTDLESGLAARVNLPSAHSYTIWIASSASDSRAKAEDDAKYADQVLRRQRTGLALQPVIRSATGSGTFTLDIDEFTGSCIWVPGRLFDLGVPSTGATFAPESLNVVYVDEILAPPAPEEVPASTLLAGYSCPWDPNIGTVILISKALRSGGTLTHELGHGLGLREPYGGHTLLVDGFSYTNLMWPYETDAAIAPRSTFSLGQAFRINLDEYSWVPRITGISRVCDALGRDRSCPVLARDLVSLPPLP